jgi:hypothetical protein
MMVSYNKGNGSLSVDEEKVANKKFNIHLKMLEKKEINFSWSFH